MVGHFVYIGEIVDQLDKYSESKEKGEIERQGR
jgi:hypothetical protein